MKTRKITYLYLNDDGENVHMALQISNEDGPGFQLLQVTETSISDALAEMAEKVGDYERRGDLVLLKFQMNGIDES